MKKRKKKLNKILKYLLITLTPIALSVGGYYIYRNFIQEPGIPSVNKLIKDKKKIGFSDKDDNKPDVNNYVNPLPDMRAASGNMDVMGYLEIPNLGVNTQIVRTTDNSFYLNYNLYKQWDGLGMPFFDYRNTDLNNSKQINIYGHNTQREEYYDQLPFINLEAYVDKNIFENYNDVYLSIDERQIHYEVVAIKILTDGNPEHTKIAFQNNSDFLSHAERMMSGSLYMSEGANLTASDNLLVLQVCHYNPMGSYLLVICKEKR